MNLFHMKYIINLSKITMSLGNHIKHVFVVTLIQVDTVALPICCGHQHLRHSDGGLDHTAIQGIQNGGAESSNSEIFIVPVVLHPEHLADVI